MNTTNSITLSVEGAGIPSGSAQSQCAEAGNTYQAYGLNNTWCLTFVCLGTDMRLITLSYNSVQVPFPPNPNTLTVAPDGPVTYTYELCV
ncbi:hypothetical protein BGW42_006150 [Actinomortierella wolfii]|nr:hypothetical protein BGW42_006150 [Actinomortierella wolfii]